MMKLQDALMRVRPVIEFLVEFPFKNHGWANGTIQALMVMGTFWLLGGQVGMLVGLFSICVFAVLVFAVIFLSKED